MSILLLGDIHGEFCALTNALREARQHGITSVIQVGDFGYFAGKNDQALIDSMSGYEDITVYFIDGNHDDCDLWNKFDCMHGPKACGPVENLMFVPRGCVFEVDGRNIAFMGGAASIDKAFRIQYKWFWTEGENITKQQIANFAANYAAEVEAGRKIDMFITHCPPNSIIQKHFPAEDKLRFGVPIDWIDPNQMIIQNLWAGMNYPPIYSGHMHKSVRPFFSEDREYCILNIDEIIIV